MNARRSWWGKLADHFNHWFDWSPDIHITVDNNMNKISSRVLNLRKRLVVRGLFSYRQRRTDGVSIFFEAPNNPQTTRTRRGRFATVQTCVQCNAQRFVCQRHPLRGEQTLEAVEPSVEESVTGKLQDDPAAKEEEEDDEEEEEKEEEKRGRARGERGRRRER